jgi:phosphinothricin acetyltransferase
MIRPATPADAAPIARIYNHYIQHTTVTFEEEVIPAAEMVRRMDEVSQASLPWLVAELEGKVVGYAYASRWKQRIGYRFSTEISVYLDPAQPGKGLGTQLYTRLFEILGEMGLHSVIGGIALPNEASVALHQKFGMEQVAHFKQTGFKFGQWIDVGYWQRHL